MATNSIGSGRFNVAVPLWEEEALLLHRAAGQERSRVDLVRELILEGARVKFPKLAAEIESIRTERLRARAVKVLVNGCFIAGLGLQIVLSQTVEARALRTTTRRRHDTTDFALNEWREA